jgi:hypothetical protein
MSTEPASVLHRFVPFANEPDYLALGWMRERPLRSGIEEHLGVWLIWPCITCLPIEPPSSALCGGWWPPMPTHGGDGGGDRDGAVHSGSPTSTQAPWPAADR